MQLHFSRVAAAVILSAPVAVFACEGECIVGITNAFLGNYSIPINNVFAEMGNEIIALVRPEYIKPAIAYVQPLLTAYHKNAYKGMETAIFPSYFHGKCQIDGVQPLGCPNPDCPIVCGTPGSLVHFYSMLKHIAYNETKYALESLAVPGNEAYEVVVKGALAEARRSGRGAVKPNTRRMLRYSRSMVLHSRPMDEAPADLTLTKRDYEKIRGQLKRILAGFSRKLEVECGGNGRGKMNGLPKCSWEFSMKQYILTFP